LAVVLLVVSQDYLSTLRVPLRAGRFFEEKDFRSPTPVVIANQSFVWRYFPNEDPLEKRIRLGDRNSSWRTIVGIVGDVRHSGLNREPEPQVYVPYAARDATSTAMLAVRTDTDPRGSA
jgi:MacB-like periplasmic core domain